MQCWAIVRSIPESGSTKIWAIFESEDEALIEAFRMQTNYRGGDVAENLAHYRVVSVPFYGKVRQE